MTDRELLELAAKAAGYKADFTQPYEIEIDGTWIEWDPLTDDGDALRLAVKLKIEIVFMLGGLEVGASQNYQTLGALQSTVIDQYAATRRAIVRAAAEVMTGSIPAVPTSGILVIESTAEGQEGEFYDLTQRAKALADQDRTLTADTAADTIKNKVDVSDDEIVAAFKNTNFGHSNYRELLNASVFKKLVGYHCGHTITVIMQELGLIGKTRKVTKRGIALVRKEFGHLMKHSG